MKVLATIMTIPKLGHRMWMKQDNVRIDQLIYLILEHILGSKYTNMRDTTHMVKVCNIQIW